MEKEWSGSKVDVFLDDAANEKFIRRSFAGANHLVSDGQVTAFTQALDTVSELPVSHALLIEEYRYSI
ncbi:hypothetical protein GCM10008929_04010 [Alkalibacterium psychrotolerans]